MILETITLAVLGVVLLVKYGTATHIAKLNQRELELKNICQEFRGRQKSLLEERKAAEHEERDLRAKMAGLETNLEDLRSELQEQDERNRELRDRIADQ